MFKQSTFGPKSVLFFLIASLCVVPYVFSKSDNATFVIKREKKFTYLALATRVRVDGEKRGKVKNGKTLELEVQPGRRTIKVSTFSSPGSSTITLDVEPGETYTFEITPRKDSLSAGILAGPIGIMVSAEGSQGGLFGIRLASTTKDLPTLANSSLEGDASVSEDNVSEISDPTVGYSEESSVTGNRESITDSIYNQLIKLQELRDMKILTEAEFNEQKQKILSETKQ